MPNKFDFDLKEAFLNAQRHPKKPEEDYPSILHHRKQARALSAVLRRADELLKNHEPLAAIKMAIKEFTK